MTVKESDRFGLWISVLNRSAFTYLSREVRRFSIGPGQQAYLLAVQPGETVTQDEIAARLFVDKANVARAIARLEKLTLVARTESSVDRRHRNVSLTPKGESVRKEIIAILEHWIDNLHSTLDDNEWKTTVESIEKLARRALEMAHGEL